MRTHSEQRLLAMILVELRRITDPHGLRRQPVCLCMHGTMACPVHSLDKLQARPASREPTPATERTEQ